MAKRRSPQPGKGKGSTSSRGKPGRTAVSAGVSPHHDMAAATEMSRNALQRERYQLTLRIIFGLLVTIALAIALIAYLATRPIEYRYFTTDPEGRIREITALNKPMPASDQVLNWAATAVTRAYTMSFANYQQQLDDIRHNFTNEGWRGFEEALRRAGFIDGIVRNQFVTTSVVREAPVIVAQGLVGDAYAWRVQVPIVVTYQSANIRDPKSLMVEITVVRRPETENPAGLGIAQFVTK